MSETKKRNPDRRPNYTLRRRVALGALAVTGLAGARAIPNSGAEWVTDPPIRVVKDLVHQFEDAASNPRGRKVEGHTMTIPNANSIQGGEQVVVYPSNPKRSK